MNAASISVTKQFGFGLNVLGQVEDILDNAPRSVMFRLFYVVENNQGVFQENFLYD
jgi:hypothetical protein